MCMHNAGSVHSLEGDRTKGNGCATPVEDHCTGPPYTPPEEGPAGCEPDQANHRGANSQVQADGGC